MKNKKRRIPELLAPAGSIAAGLTAFDYGADAVYAGLNKFNARERTENFSLEDMSKLINYAHKIDKKVFVTFNTLIKENELPEVAESLFELSCLKPDAVIVQDIGVVRMIRDYFPNLTIHASTQMCIHNSSGVNFASKLGIKRVILERQVSLDETRRIIKETSIETEVFIQGALCCSVSGGCLFSSWQGGWSGNRGKCKQPCRRRYFSDEGNGFFFSPKDLYSLDIIDELKEIGVSSLKIEGRLRKSDYVKNVVSAYRLMLDTPSTDTSLTALKKAKDILSRSLGRKWSSGFKDKDACKDVIQHKLLGVSGQPYGQITSVNNGGFKVFLSQRLHMGDRLRIQPKSGDEGPTVTITKISFQGKSVTKVQKGNECFIHCDKEIPKDGIVYKIGESGGELTSRIEQLPIKPYLIDLSINVSKNGFYIKLNNLPQLSAWQKKMQIEPAKNRKLENETVIKEFKASTSVIYKTDNINVSIIGDLFIPASELKKVRREFWGWFTDNINDEMFYAESLAGFQKLQNDIYKTFKTEVNNTETNDKSYTRTTVSTLPDKGSPVKDSVTVHDINDFGAKSEEIQLPSYCFEHELHSMKRKVRAAISKGHYKFRVTSLYGFDLLKGYKNLQISTSYPLPVCNSSAAYEIKQICIKGNFKHSTSQIWPELEKESIFSLLKTSPINMEVYTYGRIPLLITRAFIPIKGRITDSKGNIFIVIKNRDNGLAYLYSDKVFSIPSIENCSQFIDLTNAELNEENSSTFNFEYNLL